VTTAFYRALAEGLARSGQLDEASATITRAVELAERDGGTFDLPDLLRTLAEIILTRPEPDVVAGEALLVRSLECAREQSALGWELRTAVQLARPWRQRGRVLEARDVLAGSYRQFTEGFETADLKAARRLLGELDK
jgi:predicted ATPase